MIFVDIEISELESYIHPYVISVANLIFQNTLEVPFGHSYLTSRHKILKLFYRNTLVCKWLCGYKIGWITKAIALKTITGISKFLKFQIPSQTYILGVDVGEAKNALYYDQLLAYLIRYLQKFVIQILKHSKYKHLLEKNLYDIKRALFDMTRELLFEALVPYYTTVDVRTLDLENICPDIYEHILEPCRDTYPQFIVEVGGEIDYGNEVDGNEWTDYDRNAMVEELRAAVYQIFCYKAMSDDTGSPVNIYDEEHIYLSQPYTYDNLTRTITPADQCVYQLEYDGYQWTIPDMNLDDDYNAYAYSQ